MEIFEHLNYLAIIVALAATVVISALWYSPALFGNAWMGHFGFTEESLKETGMGKPLAIAIAANLVFAVAIAIVCARTGDPGVLHGLKVGLFLGAGVGVASMLPHYAFQRQKAGLMLIDGAHTTVCAVVMGIIIGAWV